MPRRASLPAVTEAILRRTGSTTTAGVPAEVRALLDAGLIESVNLSEWLVVDQPKLLATVCAAHDWSDWLPEFTAALERLKTPTTPKRLEAIGQIFATQVSARSYAGLVKTLRSHPSDIVRGWGAYVVGRRVGLTLSERLTQIRPFAADGNMGVREVAWMAVRAPLAAELTAGIALLAAWTGEADANLRRFATEATRPRGVWCRHITALKEAPELGLPILEPLKADPAKYVRDSVANWLNDASKSRPTWVQELCDRWVTTSPGRETAAIVQRALRTLRNS